MVSLQCLLALLIEGRAVRNGISLIHVLHCIFIMQIKVNLFM